MKRILFPLFLAIIPILRAGPLTIFETPDSKEGPVLDAIASAKSSVNAEVYEMDSDDVINALIAQQKKGHPIKVILNKKNTPLNQSTFNQLTNAGVDVHWASSKIAGFTHEKAIIIDSDRIDSEVLILTLNLNPNYMGLPDPKKPDQGISVNFGVIDKDSQDVKAVAAMFDADWNSSDFTPVDPRDLVISPVNSRSVIIAQIRAATISIDVFAQEINSADVLNELCSAADSKRHVSVRVLAANAPESILSANEASATKLRAAGVGFLYLKNPYQHAKAMIIDKTHAYVGSINYTDPSMDKNRELGIESTDPTLITTLENYFEEYWKAGSKSP